MYLSCVPGLVLWLENRHGIHVSLADKDEKMKHLSARGGGSVGHDASFLVVVPTLVNT